MDNTISEVLITELKHIAVNDLPEGQGKKRSSVVGKNVCVGLHVLIHQNQISAQDSDLVGRKPETTVKKLRTEFLKRLLMSKTVLRENVHTGHDGAKNCFVSW